MSFVLYETLQNLLIYSEQFDNSVWLDFFGGTGSVTRTADSETSPSGAQTADKIEFVVGTGGNCQLFQGATLVDGDLYAESVYFKWLYGGADTAKTYLKFTGNISPWPSYAVIDLEPYFDGEWHRIDISAIKAIDGMDGRFNITSAQDIVFAVWGAQINNGSLKPYVKTEATTLTDDAIYVDVYPEWSLKDSGKKMESRHRARDGSEYVYKWGDYDLIDAPVEFVSRSFKSQVNSWFGANTDLIWMENHVFDISSVHIVNKSKPIDKLNKPYTDQYKGKIQLGTY